MLKRKLVLNWNINNAKQDGYIHTRSFPLSLGNDEAFSEIKENHTPIVFLIPSFNEYAIISVSREKYPGEINSISKGSKNNQLLNRMFDKYPFLNDKKIIGYSYLYNKILNIFITEKNKKLKIRKDVILQLYSTDLEDVFILDIIDTGNNQYRDYQIPVFESSSSDEEYIYDDDQDKADFLLKETKGLSVKDVLKKASQAKNKTIKHNVMAERYSRNIFVTVFAIKRSNGYCELCNNIAPFKKDTGERYLEVHHIVPLSQGGEDSPENVAALCPNCHRMLHYGEIRLKKSKELKDKIEFKMKGLFSP